MYPMESDGSEEALDITGEDVIDYTLVRKAVCQSATNCV